MLEWKVLGVMMIVPTLTVAIIITMVTRDDDEFFINLAICFWISANAYWMCCEFFGHVELKDYAGYPFLAGIISVAWFYFRRIRSSKSLF